MILFEHHFRCHNLMQVVHNILILWNYFYIYWNLYATKYSIIKKFSLIKNKLFISWLERKLKQFAIGFTYRFMHSFKLDNYGAYLKVVFDDVVLHLAYGICQFRVHLIVSTFDISMLTIYVGFEKISHDFNEMM